MPGDDRPAAEVETMLWIRLGAALAAVGVAAGAFGAHGLKERVPPEMLVVWRTGAFYHLIHALALFVLGAWSLHATAQPPRGAGWLFVAGIALFSGSLYAMVLTGHRALGAITPLGGLCFIAAWSWIAIAAAR
jgi:uncharacterized membrane protein YgdD (TMEM256/DUF423 family)